MSEVVASVKTLVSSSPRWGEPPPGWLDSQHPTTGYSSKQPCQHVSGRVAVDEIVVWEPNPSATIDADSVGRHL